MIEAAQVNAAIRDNCGAWLATHGKIYPKDRSLGVITPHLNFLQKKIQATITHFEMLGLPIRIMGLKPRQKGSTTMFAAQVYTFLRRRAASAVLIGGQFSQVDEAWGMMKTYQKHDSFPNWGNTGEINTKAGAWNHGSKLIGETAKDVLAGVGGTHQVLHGFEVARWARHGVAASADVLANITKSVPLGPNTMIILESTAEGKSGDFYIRYCNAVDAERFISGEVTVQSGSYVRVFAPWFEFDDSAMRLDEDEQREIELSLDSDPEFDGEADLIKLYGTVDDDGVQHLGESVTDFTVWEQLAWRRWSIREECKRDKNVFNRDYPHSWETAFQASGQQRFNETGLAIARRRLIGRPILYGTFEEASSRRVAFRQTSQMEAKVKIFEKPISGCRYLHSNDVMTGETQVGSLEPDRHSGFILRAGYYDKDGRWQRPATAARIVQCRWDIDVYEEQVWRIARYYGSVSGCCIAIEMNMDRGLTELLKLRGANLYQREMFNQREQRTTKAYGYQTTVKTRETMIDTLAAAIREWDTPGHGIDIWCPEALEQCENFVTKANGKSEAAEGHKDDDVISVALGLELIDHATLYVGERQMGFNSPGYRPPEPEGRQSAYS